MVHLIAVEVGHAEQPKHGVNNMAWHGTPDAEVQEPAGWELGEPYHEQAYLVIGKAKGLSQGDDSGVVD